MRKKRNIRIQKLTVGAVFSVLLIVGCSVTPKAINMIPVDEEHVFENKSKTIEVDFPIGGKESDPMWEGSKIDNASFLNALIMSLKQSNLFTEVDPAENPDIRLSTFIMSQGQPSFGINMTVTLLVRYTLTIAANGSLIWEKDIPSSYTATVGEAFVGAVRVRKANEGAVRENLKALLNELDATSFQ